LRPGDTSDISVIYPPSVAGDPVWEAWHGSDGTGVHAHGKYWSHWSFCQNTALYPDKILQNSGLLVPLYSEHMVKVDPAPDALSGRNSRGHNLKII
jgi:hypothetical protein